MKICILSLGAALLFSGCSGGVKGTYLGGDDSLLRSLTFKADGKVDVVLVNGIGGEGTYEIDDDKVRVSANGTTNELTIGDDNCLHGPLMVGTLCQGERPEVAASSGTPARDVGELAGSTFEAAANGGGRMALQFTDRRTVRVSTVVPGSSEATGAIEGTYSTSGDQIVIDIQGDAASFTRSGNTLTGNLGGDQVTFTRK